MSFLTGMMLFDCPASALNNAGSLEGARVENAIAVKFIRTRQGAFPYVSAQAFRYWLRTTLENTLDLKWEAAPIFREQKIAYTDANPIRYWDDDLFGYMRAPSKKSEAIKRREEDQTRTLETPTNTEITRVSPFRVSTLVSISPVSLVEDFGTMSRHEGDPVPYEHQFYRTILKGLISLDLHACGTFSYINKTGFRNLDDNRIEEAKKLNLHNLVNEKSYRLPLDKRIERICSLLKALSVLYGGAKQATHYTDVTPKVFIGIITKGGNNPLQYVIDADEKGLPIVHTAALKEIFNVWEDQILSKLYAGWVQGFYDGQREKLEATLKEIQNCKYTIGHPRDILNMLANDMASKENESWLD
jgi:CRISPR-associated protein Cst2